MPAYEVFMPKSFNKNSVSKFLYCFQYGFDSASDDFYSEDFQSKLEIMNDAFTNNPDFKVLTFELSDLMGPDKIEAGFTNAFSEINEKHRENVHARALFGKTTEDEYYALLGGDLCCFDTIEELGDHKEMLADKQRCEEEEKAKKRLKHASKVAKKIRAESIEEHAIIRIRVEDKSHESLVRKAFDEILATEDLSAKDSIFATLMDKVTEPGETYFNYYEGVWRDDLRYRNGKIGCLNFLANLIEYDMSRKSLKLLLVDAPHKRKHYLPLVWGLFGIFGERVTIRIWSRKPDQTRFLWNYEDNIMGPNKEGELGYDDWNFTRLQSVHCNYYDWDC